MARRHGLSAKYLTALVTLLNDTRPSPVLDGLRLRWRTAKPSDVDGLVSEISRWQQALWKFSSVGHIGKVDGPKSWMEAVNPVIEEQEFRLRLLPAAGSHEVTVYLAAHNAGDGADGDFVLWREPKLVIAGRPPVPLRDVRGLIEALTARRQRIFASTAKALTAAAEASTSPGEINAVDIAGRIGVDPEDLKAWFGYFRCRFSIGFQARLAHREDREDRRLRLRSRVGHIERRPCCLRILRMRCSCTWQYEAARRGSPSFANSECRRRMAQPQGRTIRRRPGNSGPSGVRQWDHLVRSSYGGNTRQYLARGEARNAAPVKIGPFDKVRVQPGDLVSILVGPREGNHACDLTAVDLRLTPGTGRPKAGRSRTTLPAACWPEIPIRTSRDGRQHLAVLHGTSAVGRNGHNPSRRITARPLAVRRVTGRKTTACGKLESLLTGPAPSAGADTPDTACTVSSDLSPGRCSHTLPADNEVRHRHLGTRPEAVRKTSRRNLDRAASICVRAPSVIAVGCL